MNKLFYDCLKTISVWDKNFLILSSWENTQMMKLQNFVHLKIENFLYFIKKIYLILRIFRKIDQKYQKHWFSMWSLKFLMIALRLRHFKVLWNLKLIKPFHQTDLIIFFFINLTTAYFFYLLPNYSNNCQPQTRAWHQQSKEIYKTCFLHKSV